jgi:hypothetical protein
MGANAIPVTEQWLAERGGLRHALVCAVERDGGNLGIAIDDEWAGVGAGGPTPGAIVLIGATVLQGDPDAAGGAWISGVLVRALSQLVVGLRGREPLVLGFARAAWIGWR